MPRRLLRDGAIAVDDWVYLEDSASPESEPRLIVPFAQWRAERERWLPAATTRAAGAPLTAAATVRTLGVELEPADRVEDLAPDLAHFALVAANFPGPADGRGYTQGRLLRERYAFKGELRASNYAHIDQVFFLARCGFNSMELPESEFERGVQAFRTFTARYLTMNDRGLPFTLAHR